MKDHHKSHDLAFPDCQEIISTFCFQQKCKFFHRLKLRFSSCSSPPGLSRKVGVAILGQKPTHIHISLEQVAQDFVLFIFRDISVFVHLRRHIRASQIALAFESMSKLRRYPTIGIFRGFSPTFPLSWDAEDFLSLIWKFGNIYNFLLYIFYIFSEMRRRLLLMSSSFIANCRASLYVAGCSRRELLASLRRTLLSSQVARVACCSSCGVAPCSPRKSFAS